MYGYKHQHVGSFSLNSWRFLSGCTEDCSILCGEAPVSKMYSRNPTDVYGRDRLPFPGPMSFRTEEFN